MIFSSVLKEKEERKHLHRNNLELVSLYILEGLWCCSLCTHCSFGLNLDNLLLVSLGHRCLSDNRNNWSPSKVTTRLQRGDVKDMKSKEMYNNLKCTVRTLHNRKLVD